MRTFFLLLTSDTNATSQTITKQPTRKIWCQRKWSQVCLTLLFWQKIKKSPKTQLKVVEQKASLLYGLRIIFFYGWQKILYFISIEQDLFSGFPLYFFRPPFNINIIDTNLENHHFRIYDNYNDYSIIRSSHLSYITVIMIEFA